MKSGTAAPCRARSRAQGPRLRCDAGASVITVPTLEHRDEREGVAGLFLAAMPVLIVFLIFQTQLSKGMTLGAVK